MTKIFHKNNLRKQGFTLPRGFTLKYEDSWGSVIRENNRIYSGEVNRSERRERFQALVETLQPSLDGYRRGSQIKRFWSRDGWPVGQSNFFGRNVYRSWRDAQWLRALAALAEDLGSILSTHLVAQNCNSSSKGSGTLFWPLWKLHMWYPGKSPICIKSK